MTRLLAVFILILCAVLLFLAPAIFKRERSFTLDEIIADKDATHLTTKPKRVIDKGQSVVRQALTELQDRELTAQDRIRSYTSKLQQAESALSFALKRDPSLAEGWSSLAAVRAELSPPATEDQAQALLALVRRASRMAPERPKVLRRHGELLLRMGRQEEALETFSKAIRLDMSLAESVVNTLNDQWIPSAEVKPALPDHLEVTNSLWLIYAREKDFAGYAQLVMDRGECAHRGLLVRFGRAIAQLDSIAEAQRFLASCEPGEDPDTVAEHFWQRAQLAERTGDHESAQQLATQAVKISNHTYFAQQQGSLLLRLGKPKEAILAFREALRRVKAGSTQDAQRAGLYRQMARSYEAAGEGDRAFDAWKRAAALDPQDTMAPRRLREMEAAAGILR